MLPHSTQTGTDVANLVIEHWASCYVNSSGSHLNRTIGDVAHLAEATTRSDVTESKSPTTRAPLGGKAGCHRMDPEDIIPSTRGLSELGGLSPPQCAGGRPAPLHCWQPTDTGRAVASGGTPWARPPAPHTASKQPSVSSPNSRIGAAISSSAVELHDFLSKWRDARSTGGGCAQVGLASPRPQRQPTALPPLDGCFYLDRRSVAPEKLKLSQITCIT